MCISFEFLDSDRFLSFLVSVGFLLVVVGVGFWSFTQNIGLIMLGLSLLALAVILQVWSRRKN